MDEQLKKTAYHEAGHGVSAYRLGLQVGELTIIPNKEKYTLGYSLSEGEWCTGELDKEAIITCYAGYEAEKIFNSEADKRGSAADDEHAERLLKVNGFDEAELREETRQLLEDNWNIVEIVAEQLLKDKLLKDDEWTIIIDAIDEGGDWKEALAELRRVMKYIEGDTNQ